MGKQVKQQLAEGLAKLAQSHHQRVAKLQDLLEACRATAKCTQEMTRHPVATYVKPGQTRRAPNQELTNMSPGEAWCMLADLRRQLVFLREIFTTTLRPDLFMWSAVRKPFTWLNLPSPGNSSPLEETPQVLWADCRVPRGWLETQGACGATAPQFWVGGVKLVESSKGVGRRGSSRLWLWRRRLDVD